MKKDVLYYTKDFWKENEYHETCKDIEYKKITEYSKKRWMRRMPDILSVSLQDSLYSGKSDLRAV